MALPQGALEALLGEGGASAFDQVIAEDRAATDAAMNKPILAKNEWNQSKQPPPATTKDNAVKDEPKSTAPPKGTFDFTDMTDADAITLAGIRVANLLSQLEPDSGALAALGEYVLNEGIGSQVTNDLVNWWTDVVVETIGRDDVDYDELEAKFNTDWKRKLTDGQRSALAKWMRRLLAEGSE
jgi:hypothetical protein